MASTGAAHAHEIVRLELLAEQVADTSGTVESFLANLAESVHGAAANAVAFTSVAGDGTVWRSRPSRQDRERCGARRAAGSRAAGWAGR